MVINLHDYHGRNAPASPGVVAPGFSEAVASDGAADPERGHGSMDNSPSLHPADRTLGVALAGKKKSPMPMGKIPAQGIDGFWTEGNGLFLTRFSLGDGEALPEAPSGLVVYVIPAQGEQVADPQGSRGTKDD